MASAQRKLFHLQRDIIGRLIEVHKVTVASEVTGQIIDLPIEEGTSVIGGETLLATVDDVWSRLAKQRIQAQMESAKIMLRFQREELERFERLTNQEAITQSELDARLMVPESVVNLLHIDQELAIRIDPLQEEVPGKVASITPYGPMASRTFPVRVRLVDQNGMFKVGMSVTASIPTDQGREMPFSSERTARPINDFPLALSPGTVAS